MQRGVRISKSKLNDYVLEATVVQKIAYMNVQRLVDKYYQCPRLRWMHDLKGFEVPVLDEWEMNSHAE